MEAFEDGEALDFPEVDLDGAAGNVHAAEVVPDISDVFPHIAEADDDCRQDGGRGGQAGEHRPDDPLVSVLVNQRSAYPEPSPATTFTGGAALCVTGFDGSADPVSPIGCRSIAPLGSGDRVDGLCRRHAERDDPFGGSAAVGEYARLDSVAPSPRSRR